MRWQTPSILQCTDQRREVKIPLRLGLQILRGGEYHVGEHLS
jgi:hypothetical protein